jgi:hypothetical protein
LLNHSKPPAPLREAADGHSFRQHAGGRALFYQLIGAP